MFGNVRGGNYGRVGQALAREQRNLHEVNMATSPDYGMIAKESIKARSKERQAVTLAEAAVHKAGLDSLRYKKGYELKADAEKAVEDIKRPARRMAGIVGAAGTLAGAVLLKKGMDEDKLARAERDALTAEFRRKTLEAYDNAAPGPLKPLPKPPVYQKPDLLPIPEITIDPGTGGGSGSDGASTPSSTTPAGTTRTGAGTMTDAEVRKLAVKAGFSPESARIISAVAGSESGRWPDNDTKKSGLFQRTGEDSVGLTQINWGYHAPRGWLQKMGITKREQLYDPLTNLKAAKYLYDGRGGGFDDWTDWGNGRYKDYLDR